VFCWYSGYEIEDSLSDYELLFRNSEVIWENVVKSMGTIGYQMITGFECARQVDGRCVGNKLGDILARSMDMSKL